ncbi:MAG: hypothetical protein WEA77_02650 [Hyphomonas sp.]|uniref:hypothetical protein n=1 Tax=Hyphomonas sp. TaxID=87 RepID=UPI0034A0035F
MRKAGAQLVIEPAAAPSLAALLKTLQSIEDDFAPIQDARAEPVDCQAWLQVTARFLLGTGILSGLVPHPQGRTAVRIAALGEDDVAAIMKLLNGIMSFEQRLVFSSMVVLTNMLFAYLSRAMRYTRFWLETRSQGGNSPDHQIHCTDGAGLCEA